VSEKKYRQLCSTDPCTLLLTLDEIAEENDGRLKDLQALKPFLLVLKIPFQLM
jgi:hypothetical protein